MDWMLMATAVADREAERIDAMNDVNELDFSEVEPEAEDDE